MSQEWYYSVDGGREGPVSAGELKKKADAGAIKATDLVWKDGMADWVPAKSIKGLFAAGAAGAAATGSATPSGGTAAKTSEKPAASKDED